MGHRRKGLVEISKWNAHSEIPFGNFGLPFKKSRFPEKISVLHFICISFTFHPKFPDFWVNSKQPLCRKEVCGRKWDYGGIHFLSCDVAKIKLKIEINKYWCKSKMQSNRSEMKTDEKQASSLATKPPSKSLYTFCAFYCHLPGHFGKSHGSVA